MFNIKKYLDKFSKDLSSIESNKQEVLRVIEKSIGVEVPSDSIEIKDYTVIVSASPAVKNKIFIYKSKILEEIKNNLGLQIVDIK